MIFITTKKVIKIKKSNFPKKSFKNVTFTYGKEEVLKDINLTIPMSGLTVIMGESGTGKTTLIDLICGFYQITKGMILLDVKIFKISIFDLGEII